ncbi:MAG: DMT family transporter [Candidatus Anaerobiospirillum merdipullorum]|uniref:DMT family transporter n=1 Tax=Candidatus Anaerobiospirillum merdipullorum TaxID=2838450 RepID=A0A9E2KMK8_9GAMM|nr:DMT family transporter [Candidatus Anaerobiospirillum merdipullorum]
MKSTALIGHLAMFTANSMFGLLSPIAKIVLIGGVISPFVMTELRISGAMILFWLAAACRPHEHVPHGDLLRFFFAAMFAIVFNQGSFIFGVGLTSPADASILTTSMPLWAMLFAAFILKDPITGKKVLGLAAGAIGALILIISSQPSTAGAVDRGWSGLLGDLLVTTAQMSFGFYVVRFKDLVSRYSLFTSMKWMFTFAFVLTVPFTARQMAAVPWETLDLTVYLSLAFVVVGATFLAYVLLVVGQLRLQPTVVGMYNYVQPVVACIVAIYLGLDHFTLIKGFAVALIFVGVYIVTHSRTKEEIEAYHQRQAQQQAKSNDSNVPK